MLEPIRADLNSGKNNPQVLAQEPAEYIDFQKNFYLLPILQGEEVMNSKGFYERILEVASVSKDDKALKTIQNNPAQVQNTAAKTAVATNPTATANTQKITGFSAAIVFVIDSSISMDPYINRTREAMKQIYAQIEKENLGEQVKFGLVSFRSIRRRPRGWNILQKCSLIQVRSKTARIL